MPDQPARILGIVSNSWKQQLDGGQSLDSLVDQAEQLGFQAIELRQGCLGEYESAAAEAGSLTEASKRLTSLARRHRAVRFNLAISLPYFAGSLSTEDSRIQNGMAAAAALAGEGQPHLRIVDTETRTLEPSQSAVDHAVATIVWLTKSLSATGGTLSIEHAYQSWSVFWSTIQAARGELQAATSLRICFDPCNLLLTEPIESVLTIVGALSAADLSMVHLKQRRDGQIQGDVAEGDLDWNALIADFDQRGVEGPWLFEVAPGASVWDNLQRSRDHIFGRR